MQDWTRRRNALYQGKKTSLTIPLTPSSLNLIDSPRTAGDVIK